MQRAAVAARPCRAAAAEYMHDRAPRVDMLCAARVHTGLVSIAAQSLCVVRLHRARTYVPLCMLHARSYVGWSVYSIVVDGEYTLDS